jgi:competence protein ComEA
MKRIFPYLLGMLIGFTLLGTMLYVSSQPRGQAIVLLPAPTPAPLVVDVGGAVAHPGVYSLPTGSRVKDAITLAGGFAALADSSALNLASRLRDGQKLFVPVVPAAQIIPGEEATPLPVSYPIDLNVATLEELDSLPGIGATRAQDIIDYREAHNGFRSIDEVQQVGGIGQTTFNRIKDLITVEELP